MIMEIFRVEKGQVAEILGDSADEQRVAEGADMAQPDETLLEEEPAPVAPPLLAAPRPRKLVAPKPEMNRRQRLIFTAYLAVIVMVMAFLAVMGLVALLSA
jgi:hypothetical protein